MFIQCFVCKFKNKIKNLPCKKVGRGLPPPPDATCLYKSVINGAKLWIVLSLHLYSVNYQYLYVVYSAFDYFFIDFRQTFLIIYTFFTQVYFLHKCLTSSQVYTLQCIISQAYGLFTILTSAYIQIFYKQYRVFLSLYLLLIYSPLFL